MGTMEYFALREIFYQAWGLYHEASGIYWSALTPEHAPVDTGHLVLAVRTAAAALDTALIALRDYLDQHEPSERDDEERTRITRIQELLVHELALLPADE